MSTSRGYHHGDARESLLAAAERACDANDMRSLSLRELARDIGVSPAAPYKHFATKEALLRELAERWMAQFVDSQVAALDDPERTVSAAEAAGCAYVAWAVAHPRRFAWIYDPDVVGDRSPEFALQMARHRDVLRRVAAEAGPAADANATPGLATRMWATVHGLAVLSNIGLVPEAEAVDAIRLNVRRQPRSSD